MILLGIMMVREFWSPVRHLFMTMMYCTAGTYSRIHRFEEVKTVRDIRHFGCSYRLAFTTREYYLSCLGLDYNITLSSTWRQKCGGGRNNNDRGTKPSFTSWTPLLNNRSPGCLYSIGLASHQGDER